MQALAPVVFTLPKLLVSFIILTAGWEAVAYPRLDVGPFRLSMDGLSNLWLLFNPIADALATLCLMPDYRRAAAELFRGAKPTGVIERLAEGEAGPIASSPRV